MKKKIAILGSTGSIGKTLINIIKKNSKKYDVVLLTSNSNYKLLLKQASILKAKNILITDKKSYQIAKKKNKEIKIFNDFNSYKKIFKKNKVDYVMSSIVGLAGLKPTLNIIKFTKKIAIANKESLICGWNLIEKEILKHRVKFIPVDSEHFSIWYALKNNNDEIKKIYLTASGGPFINYPINKLKNIKVSQAINHPNWRMGKKISIDSATMINKVFEVIEAKNIFNLSYKDISILTHPTSYIHSLINFKNGLVKIIAHSTDMAIPIFNSMEENIKPNFPSKEIDFKKLNKLDLKKINKKRFPVTKIINMLSNNQSLFETVIVSANDELVKLFLNKEIKFTEISTKLLQLLKYKEFTKFKRYKAKNVDQIIKLNNYVRLKINPKSI